MPIVLDAYFNSLRSSDWRSVIGGLPAKARRTHAYDYAALSIPSEVGSERFKAEIEQTLKRRATREKRAAS